jgi:hypothetical protein
MSLVLGQTYDQYVRKDKKGNPIFVTEFADGTKQVLTGWEGQVAAHAHKEPFAFKLNTSPDVQDVLIKMNPDDPRNRDFKFKLNKALNNLAYSDTGVIGKILNKGPLYGGALGAGVGYAGGALTNIIAEKLGHDIPLDLGLIGALGLGGLGALLGHSRKELRKKPIFRNDKSDPMDRALIRRTFAISDSVPHAFMKRAAMYNNPRNFILEKLQGDKAVGFAEKAKLAAAIQNLSMEEAEQLKQLVRESLGARVSTIISKFIFKRENAGALFGGLVEFLGKDFVSTLINK